MTVIDIASRLNELNDDGIIFAERIDDAFMPNSRAVVLGLSEAEYNQDVSEIAATRCPGLEYCLEVRIAKDAVRVWSQWRADQEPSPFEAAEAICHKATFDAWGPPNW